ncbi:hypothetical protein [Cerasicoccus arenae]|uniref:Uncharacterized protein n=1 Tax=Cerasicoccus arenae TaxID=424488 RepID=A0A8J3DDZ3_9BACT|nr:hypothetical protein [Cerasicoccus arenae]MBK1857472.1 hypothetical protein [Cerasicoccus arenae]GHB95224.1 hypothetical protein GCM10007047_08620 [Cerasicoccus arenae]
MPFTRYFPLPAVFGLLLISTVTSHALYNNVYLMVDGTDPDIAGTWLTETLPTVDESTAPKAKTVQSQQLVETGSEEVRFSPTVQPGAAFRKSSDDFSQYREAFGSKY